MTGFFRRLAFLIFIFLYRSTDWHLIDSLFFRYTFSRTFHTLFLGFIFLLGPAFSLSFFTKRTLFSRFLVFVAASIKSLVYIRSENGNQSGERFTISWDGENWLLRITSLSVYFAAAFITGSGRISFAAAVGSLSTVSLALTPIFLVDVALYALLAFWFTIILSFYFIFTDCTRFVEFFAILTSFVWLSSYIKMLKIKNSI